MKLVQNIILVVSLLASTVGFSRPEMDQLTQLSIRLNSKYWRGLDQNDFSLSYSPVPPQTIQLRVRYKRIARVEEIEKLVAGAKLNVVGFAKKEFNMNVETSVDMAPLD